tara:strand:+ start:634 stop:741 length:108 start_codon:yes stop_codon:yes gene_type:complete
MDSLSFAPMNDSLNGKLGPDINTIDDTKHGTDQAR